MSGSVVHEVISEIYESIQATPKKQRRLRSSTFWDKLKITKRTKDRVDEIARLFAEKGIVVNIDGQAFGSEPKEAWLVLSHLQPDPPVVDLPASQIPVPPDDWFASMAARTFESEREIEYYFLVPLIEKLGYNEDDICIGRPVVMFQGTKKTNTQADVVLYDGKGREAEHALVVIEAKRSDKVLTDDHYGQVHSYAMWLAAPLSMVTNGEEARVYAFRGAALPDVRLMSFTRSRLKECWTELYRLMSRSAAVDYKAQVGRALLDEHDKAHASV